MYLSQIDIENFRCFGSGEDRFHLDLKPGLTALVGENDAGKSAVVDALRFALGTTDQEWNRLQSTDFHQAEEKGTFPEICIRCKFEDLEPQDKSALVEYLTYEGGDGENLVFYMTWTAKDTGDVVKGRPYRRVEIHSGKDGEGPSLDSKVRELLRATYMRPLRDAEQALSAGRGSRLSQVLAHTPAIAKGENGSLNLQEICEYPEELTVLGIGDLANSLLENQEGVKAVREEIDDNLQKLTLHGLEPITSTIRVNGSDASENTRLRVLLEKLDLSLKGAGKLGLGSDNLLFMACELLLLDKEDEGNKLLLIEEPEAHLHVQRQLQVMKFLQEQAEEKGIQIIVTTHSPNLASAIDLDNIVMIHQGKAFSLAEGETQLSPSDYRFLARFLDVTKANLFFARGVMIVEGDAENILLPTIARILGRDFTEHGVSIVNVGGVGLRRYARIFQRRDEEKDGLLDIPVACLTDMDVMPDCAPSIIGKTKNGEEWPELKNRQWRAKRDFNGSAKLKKHRQNIKAKADGQFVRTFVANEWTLEYDLALGAVDENRNFCCGLAEDVFVAAFLAKQDDAINAGNKSAEELEKQAVEKFDELQKGMTSQKECAEQEVLASMVYAMFTKERASKAIAAQYLAERLQNKHDRGKLTGYQLREWLPRYLVDAIDYVTGVTGQDYLVTTPEKELVHEV